MKDAPLDFAFIFERLGTLDKNEETTPLSGVDVRLVRVPGGGLGRWDSHVDSAETVVVWSGVFTVEFRDHTLNLRAGQCCVVPAGVEHRGTSATGAEVVLFRQNAEA
jgi:mannose-6-phosphate isomerase-like protein (cupin superfamily)